MSLPSSYYKLFQELPQPYTITNAQVKSYFQSLYSHLLDSYKNNDFIRIINLLDYSNYKCPVNNLKFPFSKEDQPEDTLPIDLVKLLYKIITIYPVKYYKAQYLAAKYLSKFLQCNKKFNGLTLNLYPYYKVLKYFFDDKSLFLPARMKETVESTFLNLSQELRYYFTDEIEIKSVKTNTTKQLLKKLLPIEDFSFLSMLLPPHKDRYKLYFDDFLQSLKNSPNQTRLLLSILRTIEFNIEEDFSCFLPFLSQYITDIIVKNFDYELDMAGLTLCHLVSLLFISPPTRSEIIELFDKFMPSFKMLVHPSSSNSKLVSQFVKLVVLNLHDYLADLLKEKPRKLRNFSQKISPSQGELHRFLSMTSQLNILNVANIEGATPILVETKLDPLLIDRYFEIAFQCINVKDPVSIARSGWIIMISLISSIEKSDNIINNFEAIFQLAVNNLCTNGIQSSISVFLLNVFFFIPFNREKTIKKLENVNFPALAYSYFESVVQILKSAPTNKNGDAQFIKTFKDSIILISNALFKNCEKEVFDELLPIFTSLASTDNIVHAVFIVEIILRNYCLYSSKEQCEKIVKSFKIQLELENLALSSFKYLLIVYSTLLTANLKTVEAAKKTVDFILPFTNHKDEKLRKIAYEALYFVFSVPKNLPAVDVSLKEEIMKENLFELSEFENFEFNPLESLDLTDLLFEVIDPVYQKLLTLTNPQEIQTLLNESGFLFITLDHVFQFSEGSTSKNDVGENFDGSINFVPQLIKKNSPINDKIIQCANRLIKDFPDDKKIISSILLLASLFGEKSEDFIDLIHVYFLGIASKKKNNSPYLFYLANCANKHRREFLIHPLNDNFKQLISNVVETSMSKITEIQARCIEFLMHSGFYYYPYVDATIYDKIFKDKDNTTRFPQFLHFISKIPSKKIFENNDKLLCDTLIFILKNYELNDDKTENDLFDFIFEYVFYIFPTGTNKENNPEYVALLHEIEENYLHKYPINRLYNSILIEIILVCLRQVNETSDKLLEYVINAIVHYDETVSGFAQHCFIEIMKRREKFTKEKVKIEKRNHDDFPNIFDQVSIELPSDGFYFTQSIKVSEDSDKEIEGPESYSIDSEPTNSLDLINPNATVNKDIIKIFESFKKIKIEWKYDEYLDYYSYSEFQNYQKESYCVKKYEFNNDEMLIKNIKRIFISATNSLNEKSTENGINYEDIWHHYSLYVGPYCLQKLSKVTRKYLSKYYEIGSRITSRILTDMITGFMKGIRCWKIDDRIQFFKLIYLPVISVFSSTPNSFVFVKLIILSSNINLSPYSFAPVLKILYEISQSGPNLPVFHNKIMSIISTQVMTTYEIFINSIDQLKEKYINVFIDRIGEYKNEEIESIISLLFGFLKASLKSQKNEYKTKVINIFNDIFNIKILNENVKKNLSRFISLSLFNFIDSTAPVRLLLEPVFINNFPIIFSLMNDLNVSNEEEFIVNFSLYIKNDIFFINNELEFQFVSSLIKELKNSSLPMQLILLESLNTMIERNIINISRNDYVKYEESLLDYNHYAIQKNFGNELRLKIAKIIGIFEIRNSTFNDDPNEDNVIKTCGLVLNSFLFDTVDEKVSKAIDFMELNCTSKESKNKELYEGLLEIFIHRHSNHVINEAEVFIKKCNRYLKPSYIS